MKVVQQLFSGLGFCSSKSGRSKINPCQKMFDMHKKWRPCRGARGKYVDIELGRQNEALNVTITNGFYCCDFLVRELRNCVSARKLGIIFDALKRVSKSFGGAATAAISSYRQAY